MQYSDIRCNNCGSNAVELIGNKCVCRACGMVTIDKAVTAETSQLMYQANSLLRSGDFDGAEQILTDILSVDDSCYEAHWGLFLVEQGIVYVNDYRPGIKKPTCLKISKADCDASSHLANAIRLAPAEISKYYNEECSRINAIKQEWITKASHEQPYDIFISYKDSDMENGIERTDDSITAYELYSNLSLKGYRVFYSRESLRDNTSENYEPYIYNALLTSKVMIVYGQNGQYLNSTWVRNEWSRYISLMEEGVKQGNSLVVAFENTTIDQLPLPLASKQCMDASRKTFLTDLYAHIKKVMSAYDKATKVGKISIEERAVKPRATAVAIEQVKLKSLRTSDHNEIEASEQLIFDNGMRYLQRGMVKEASNLFDDRLKRHPDSVYALLGQQMVLAKATSIESIVKGANNMDISLVSKCVDLVDGKLAEQVITAVMNSYFQADSRSMTDILRYFSEYDVPYRAKWLEEVESELLVTPSVTLPLVENYLRTVDSNNVDKHMYIMYRVATNWLKAGKFSSADKFADKMLAIDSSSYESYVIKFCVDNKLDGLVNFGATNGKKYDFDDLHKALGCIAIEYRDQVLSQLADRLVANASLSPVKVWLTTAKHIIALHSQNNVGDVVKIGYALLANSHFDKAVDIFKLALSMDCNSFQAQMGTMLATAKASSEKQLIEGSADVVKLNGYNNIINNDAMTAEQIEHCMDLVVKQKQYREDKKNSKKKLSILAKQKLIAGLLVLLLASYTVFAISLQIEWATSSGGVGGQILAVIVALFTAVVALLGVYAILSRRYVGIAITCTVIVIAVSISLVVSHFTVLWGM